jgi:3-oxoacyl-[acyl-carrier protein] reductase
MFWTGERETAVSQEPGRVALVSAGSRGIGAATVRRLAADGWDIGFSYLGDGPSAREVEKAAFELGVRATGTDVDITDAAEVSSWFRLTEEEFGPVQAVVSCAGITREQPLARLDEADWRMVIDTSLDGVFHLCRTAVFAMMARPGPGRIVAVSSVCGEYDHAPSRVGPLARPGLAGFVRALASQTRRFGITVNAVTPGPGAADVAALLPERTRADLAETIALRRFGTAAAVADLVTSLLAPDAPNVTGRVIEVPGALTL